MKLKAGGISSNERPPATIEAASVLVSSSITLLLVPEAAWIQAAMEIPNEPTSKPATPLDLGAWIGKTQAFGLIANRCSAAEAECLQHIRETRAYESLNLSWEEFCAQHVGIARSWADDLIRRLQEFGPGYFQLARITSVSAESYRLLAPSIGEKGIELDGQTIALTPENAPRIRRAILDLRADLRRARDNARDPGISQLQTRFDNWFDQLEMLKPNPLDTSTRAAVQGLIAYCRNKLSRLAVKYGC
jgi:hypothetical protein